MKIDLGCGRRKAGPDWFGIDCQALEGVDLVHDCNTPIPLEDRIADVINATDFLEHIENHNRIRIMHEIWRLLKPNGVLVSHTPSTDGRGAFQDPTHFSFWNQNSFYYYTNDAYRALYSIVPKFDVISLYTTKPDHDLVVYVHAELRAVK